MNKLVAENFNHPDWIQKVKRHNPTDEITKDHNHCLQMYDWFYHHGQFGKHFVMGFEVLGRNLLHLIKKYQFRGIPLPLVREITRQILTAMDYMHNICHLIHTDIKPENVVFSMSQEEEFDLLYKHVFCTPLIKVYDH